MLFKTLIRPVMFRASANDPEIAHHWLMGRMATLSHSQTILKIIEATNAYKSSALERDVFGVHFPNPVGLAGGFDKNGIALPALAALGFGFIEAGTVTRYAQPGNARPRIFRLSEDNALINRMGFPNDGADAIHAHLSQSPKPGIPIGWSIGKSKITPQEEAIEDYLYSLHKLYDFADFFTVNVSSPNTPGLRQLQDKEPLDRLLQAIVQESEAIAQKTGSSAKAVLVKIAPDLTESQLDDVIEVCLNRHVRGIIATNTTLARTGLRHNTSESGGLSGRPLHQRSLEVIRYLNQQLQNKIPIIGVGGIFGPDDAKRTLDAGASLIQIYTSFIYEGPGIIKRINRELARS
ncbi:quinone-dependent dihydroorotate dehydrogenase [Dictyobacter aurantiacus]|uniref:Dihydroorotate dehydrogenase (quinone) n=1 Tax=Dictyobacter aurantiacus TaxID=1936993 RepID=A0A401ZSD4_9CHLR|nr:quinone-dependent dihydroorotate dehydrogenase [Dictyobacter aurantiacus]GCE09818.1 dihydroorotate dehydrogenase (quinone) [Dictyobacter aurantiacus]